MSFPTINHFQSLGVTPTTSFADIKRAYRKLSLKYHPDKTPDKAHHEKFKEINAAFEVIRNHYEKYNNTTGPQVPTSAPNTPPTFQPSYTTYAHFSTSGPGQTFSSRQYYSRFSHSGHTASNARNSGGSEGKSGTHSTEQAYFQAFHKSQEEQRRQAAAAAERAKRSRERLVEMLKAEAEAKRKEELRRAEARRKEIERKEEERKRMEAEIKKMKESKQREAEEQRKQRKQRKQREAQEADTAYTGKTAGQNQSTNGASEPPLDDPNEDYNPYDHQPLHSKSQQENKEYQEAKQRRRDMIDAAETANQFLKSQLNPSEEDKFYQSKKNQPNDSNATEEQYMPTSKRRKNGDSSGEKRAKFKKAQINPFTSNNDIPDIEPIIISDGSYHLDDDDDDDDDEITIIKETPPGMKLNRSSNAVPRSDTTNTQNGTHPFTDEKADAEYAPEKLDEYIPFNVKPKAPPRSSTTLPTRPDKKSSPISPGKPAPPQTTYTRHRMASPHKRFKISTSHNSSAFDMGNLDINVGDIEEVDFRDLEDSLPESLKRKQPNTNSENISANTTSRRTRSAQFTDGTSSAETLATPLNKNTVRGHSAARFHTSDERSSARRLSVLDFHASPEVHNFTPPNPPPLDLSPNISRTKWKRFVESVENYQMLFIEYKELIVQYQIERTQRDFAYFETVNDLQDTHNLGVYNTCLQRDLEVITKYQEALRVFSHTMTLFQQGCQWIRKIKEHDPNWV